MFEITAKKNDSRFLVVYCEEMSVSHEVKMGELVVTLRVKLPADVTKSTASDDAATVARICAGVLRQGREA